MEDKKSTALCPACRKGTMQRSNFRTGSVDKPGASVQVCTNCGHRIELPPVPPPTPPSSK